ncbi:MAG: hypothetical protein H0X62_00505 [Bacteroidetes bacterium]|nr:hypothetical protein [Bacteroidota bacterium]
MASFDEHIIQVKRNLSFFETVNSTERFFDWQATICFYCAVHLVNSRIAKEADLHYRSHEDVKNAISPYNPTSLCKVDDNTNIAYLALEKISRRARYLCNDSNRDEPGKAFLTYDKHVARAIRHLNTIMEYFNNQYNLDFEIIKIKNVEIKPSEKLSYFNI